MVKPVDIAAELAKLPTLHLRAPDTSEEEAAASFASIVPFCDDGVFVGSFDGKSPWERHRNGDEIVQVIAGSTTLTVLTDTDTHVLTMKAGMMTVVPQGCWHRFEAPDGVSVLTVTPTPTDISSADDPRAEQD
ncbi:MAG: cupin domain-containing protein [Pseudomonadota bacterium]